MEIQIKVQIILMFILTMELLGLFMIIIRTVANLEHGLSRVEAVIRKEIQLALRHKEHEKLSLEKAQGQDQKKSKKNELLLNIPFMERLSKEKRKDNG